MKERKILIVEDNTVKSSRVMCGAINALCKKLAAKEYAITRAASYSEALPLAATDMDIDAILMAIDTEDQDLRKDEKKLLQTICRIRLLLLMKRNIQHLAFREVTLQQETWNIIFAIV